jgi:SARP family transcriptional regulator, regulator of embCAB operon
LRRHTSYVTDAAPTVLLLGPIDLRNGNASVNIGGSKVRAVLARLALAEGRVLTTDQLIDGVWGDTPPTTATNTLQYHVTVLRKALAAAGAASAIVTRPPGYVLTIATDLQMFHTHRATADAAAHSKQREQAAKSYALALACWRGPALADLLAYPFAGARATALEEERLSCVEAWIDTSLHLGRGEDLVAELEDLVAQHPTRERLWEQLMTALYRAGRQADALGAFERARKMLDEELGIEPSPGLRGIQAQVLNQDARLQPTPRLRSTVPAAATRLRSSLPTERAWLVPPDGHRLAIPRAPMTIGRDNDCDLTIDADDQISRRHARIHPTGDGHTIEDLSSTNGTYINNSRITYNTRLAHADRIEIGKTVLRYDTDEA